MREYKVLVAFGRYKEGDTFKTLSTQRPYLERSVGDRVNPNRVKTMIMDLATDPRVELIGEETE